MTYPEPRSRRCSPALGAGSSPLQDRRWVPDTLPCGSPLRVNSRVSDRGENTHSEPRFSALRQSAVASASKNKLSFLALFMQMGSRLPSALDTGFAHACYPPRRGS